MISFKIVLLLEERLEEEVFFVVTTIWTHYHLTYLKKTKIGIEKN